MEYPRSGVADRAALVVAAVAGTAAGLAAADAGLVVAALDAAEWLADRGPLAVAAAGVATAGRVSAANLPETAVGVGAACALGAARARGSGAEREGWSVVLWRYAVAAVLAAALAAAVVTGGALAAVLWAAYAALAALYTAEAWRGATRYPAPGGARWLLAASAAVPLLLAAFRGQYRRTVLAPVYGTVAIGPTEVAGLALAAGLPVAVLVALNTVALARRLLGR